jgi:hypothetical protein
MGGLARKFIVEFSVHLVEEISWETQAWENFVLNKDNKDVLMATIKAQYTEAAKSDHVIQGKGIIPVLALSTTQKGITKLLS